MDVEFRVIQSSVVVVAQPLVKGKRRLWFPWFPLVLVTLDRGEARHRHRTAESMYQITMFLSFVSLILLCYIHLTSGKCPKVGTISDKFAKTSLPDLGFCLHGKLELKVKLSYLFFSIYLIPKHEALLHNFKPMYFLDKGETIEVGLY